MDKKNKAPTLLTMQEPKYPDDGANQPVDLVTSFLEDDNDILQENQILSGANNVKPDRHKEHHTGNDIVALLMQDKLQILEAELQEQRALILNLTERLEEKEDVPRGLTFFGSSTEDDVPGKSKLPNDIYSFFICCELCSRHVFFATSVFSIQIITYVLLAMNQITLGGSDSNPLNYPVNVETHVRVTEFICIGITVLTQEDLRVALELASEGYSSQMIKDAFHNSSHSKWWLSIVLRMVGGALGIIVTLFLIIRTNNVIDLLLNFTAMEFVSQLENVAFLLSAAGFFGHNLRQKSKQIEDTSYDVPVGRKSMKRYHSFLLWFVFACMLAGWTVVVHKQRSGQFLCQNIFVQFGDEVLEELGAYTGLYTISQLGVGRNDKRVRYIKKHMAIGRSGSFGYCLQDEVWTYSLDGEDVCDGWIIKSSVTSTFDILETETLLWEANIPGSQHGVQVEYFQLTCIDSDTVYAGHDKADNRVCEDDLCINVCDDHCYGFYCMNITNPFVYNAIEPPCRTLEEDDDALSLLTELDDNAIETVQENLFPKKFKIFGCKNESLQVYYNPVYVPEENVSKKMESSFIFFGGRRWYIVLESAFGNKNALQLEKSIKGAFLNSSNISLVSEAVDIYSLNEILTPLGLQWFEPDIDDTTVKYVLPFPDDSWSIDGYLVCAFCDDITNPCSYEGACNSLDGTCDCKHNTFGSLCKNKPTGDGKCDPFFNKAGFNYDGGDCCPLSCRDSYSFCEGSAPEGISSAFNQNLTSVNAGRVGYPHCIDPNMTELSIELYRNVSDISVYVELVCEEHTVLHLPFGALDRRASVINGTETVRVGDGSDCLLKIGLSDERVNIRDISVAYMYKICLGSHCDKAIDIIGQENSAIPLDGTQIMVKKNFFVSSLWKILSNYSKIGLLESDTSPQGKAIRWLSNDAHEHSSSDSPYLLQRYAILVLNFATGNRLNQYWLNVGKMDECDFSSYLSCEDGFITSLDLSAQSLNGTLPHEILLLSTLEFFSLWGNSLGGNIPSELGSMTNLKTLDMHLNNFTGTIPSEIGGMTNLISLKLSFNDLQGSIPATIGTMTNLEELDLENNGFTGFLPDLSRLLEFVELDLESNNMSGSIPEYLTDLPNLQTVVWKDNPNFHGSIPPEVCGNTRLTVYVDCTYTRLKAQNCSNIMYCHGGANNCGSHETVCTADKSIP